jgi:hypothetical protein
LQRSVLVDFFHCITPLYKTLDGQLVHPSFAALLSGPFCIHDYEKMDLDGKPLYRHSKLGFNRFRKKPVGM